MSQGHGAEYVSEKDKELKPFLRTEKGPCNALPDFKSQLRNSALLIAGVGDLAELPAP